MGHVMDLPPKSFGIDLATMQPEYVVMKADVAKKIRAAAGYQTICLASDPDREGEAIAHHVAGLLKRAKTSAKLVRVTFDAITPSAVQIAFASPRRNTHPPLTRQATHRRLFSR